MRTQSRSTRPTFVHDDYFERKARELIVPEDEIEAWELDTQDIDTLSSHGDGFNASGYAD